MRARTGPYVEYVENTPPVNGSYVIQIVPVVVGVELNTKPHDKDRRSRIGDAAAWVFREVMRHTIGVALGG